MNFNDFKKRLDPDYIPSITESIDLDEKNVPTNPKLWSQAKSLAKKKFDVYPSAYANGWAAKWYKSKGGSWKTESVEVEESTPEYRAMMKKYKGSDMEKVFKILDKEGYRLGEQGDTLVRNMLKKFKGNVKKAAAEIMNRGAIYKESVELEEKRDMTKVVGRKVPELSSDARDVLAHAINMSRNGVPGLDVPLATGKNAGKFNDGVLISALTFLRNNSSKMTPMGKKYAKEVIKVLGESVEEKSLHPDLHKFVKTKDGFQLMMYKPSEGRFVAQGKPQPTRQKAEKAAKMFASVDVDEAEDVPANVKKIAKELDKAVALHKSQADRLRKAGLAEGFASDAQRRAAFASGYKAKGKKGKKEEVEIDEASEKQMMDTLRKEYGKLNKVDPASPTYKRLTDLLDRLAKSNPQLLKKLSKAKIKFVSPLALNRVNRMKMKEEVEIDEGSAKDKRMMKSVKDKLTKAGIKNAVMFGEVHVAPNNVKEAEKIVGSMPFKVVPQKKLEEMSAKAHYNKMVAQGKVGGQVVSPIDRKRFPNREREGLEGPYRVKRSGLIYYYDKRAGKYYDPQSDMYLDVKDVMEGTYSSDSRQTGEEKPLITWMSKFEKALKSMGSSYAKVDPVEALKLYYRNVDPKKAASQLK